MERGGVVLQAKQTNEARRERVLHAYFSRLSRTCQVVTNLHVTYEVLGVGIHQLEYYPLGTQLTDCVNLSAQVHWNQNGNMCTYE